MNKGNIPVRYHAEGSLLLWDSSHVFFFPYILEFPPTICRFVLKETIAPAHSQAQKVSISHCFQVTHSLFLSFTGTRSAVTEIQVVVEIV